IGPATEGYGFTKKVYQPQADLTKARALMKAAGVNSFSFDYVTTNEQVMRDLASVLQQNWSAINVDARLQLLDLGAWTTKWVSSNWGMASIFSFDGIAFGKSADTVTRTQESGSPRNYGHFTNRIVNKLLNEARAMPPGRTRAHLFAQVSDVIAQHVGM